MLCVIAKLNDTDAEKLTAIQKAAVPDRELCRPPYGHITIASFVGKAETYLIRSCKDMMNGISAFDVTYKKIEILDETSIIAAIPERSDILERLHLMVTERFNDSLDQWTKTGRWYPHTTLLYRPAPDLYSIGQKMREAFVPFTAGIRRIEFSRVIGNGYEIADYIDLKE